MRDVEHGRHWSGLLYCSDLDRHILVATTRDGGIDVRRRIHWPPVSRAHGGNRLWDEHSVGRFVLAGVGSSWRPLCDAADLYSWRLGMESVAKRSNRLGHRKRNR